MNPTALKVSATLILFLLSLFSASFTLAQFEGSSLDVGYTFDIADSETLEGDIMVTTDKGLARANTAYNSKLFGVIQRQPLLVFKTKNSTGRPVARTGIIEVNVTTLGGAIKSGDHITSSEIPGKGQKATLSGYVIGTAMADLKEEGAQKLTVGDKEVVAGKIPVALRIEYAELSTPRSSASLFTQFNTSLFKEIKDPDQFARIFRYIAAGFVAFLGFGVGFFTFSRSVPKGVEAIGRNPLAEKAIMFSLILNIILIVVAAGIGIIGALIILRL